MDNAIARLSIVKMLYESNRTRFLGLLATEISDVRDNFDMLTQAVEAFDFDLQSIPRIA